MPKSYIKKIGVSKKAFRIGLVEMTIPAAKRIKHLKMDWNLGKSIHMA